MCMSLRMVACFLLFVITVSFISTAQLGSPFPCFPAYLVLTRRFIRDYQSAHSSAHTGTTLVQSDFVLPHSFQSLF